MYKYLNAHIHAYNILLSIHQYIHTNIVHEYVHIYMRIYKAYTHPYIIILHVGSCMHTRMDVIETK